MILIVLDKIKTEIEKSSSKKLVVKKHLTLDKILIMIKRNCVKI